jgi:hypothetical protein
LCGARAMPCAHLLASRGAAAWDKAFAFMKDTDNPILGGGAAKTRSEAAAGGGGGGDGGERAAAEMGVARASGDSDDGAPDPLRSDKFLKGFFGR